MSADGQAFLPFRHELVADLFAGGGGASEGIRQALGRCPDIAVNHNADAILMHEANHPSTIHYCEDVFLVNPKKVTKGEPVGLAWFSPDCKHFSKAKGGKPVSKKIRGLAWDAVRWARIVAPRVIILENVEEFQDWGPLNKDGMPSKAKKGLTFKRWVGCLKAAGYVVEWRELRACDFGAPTIRKRLFVIARRDGRPIVWPKPTHGKEKGLKPFRTAADCIDWNNLGHSIFLTKEEGKKVGVKRPLAPATLNRIRTGMYRYVINCADPFIINTRNGERPGQDPRVRSIREPMWTPTAHGSQGAVVTPIIVGIDNKSNGARDTWDVKDPLRTTTVENRFAMCAAFLAQHNTDMVGHDPRKPMSTIVGKGCTQAPVIVKLKGTAKHGQDVREPLHTVQAGGTHYAAASAVLTDADVAEMTGDRSDQVRAFLINYYTSGSGKTGANLKNPMPTVTTEDRIGLVTIHGTEYRIVDICMRMLQAHELFAAQGFPADYDIRPKRNGKPITSTAQVRMCGNSVCPPLAEALVRANFKHEQRYEAVAA
jgi:DNA (cytosine-5)-methyltransferase 1